MGHAGSVFVVLGLLAMIRELQSVWGQSLELSDLVVLWRVGS